MTSRSDQGLHQPAVPRPTPQASPPPKGDADQVDAEGAPHGPQSRLMTDHEVRKHRLFLEVKVAGLGVVDVRSGDVAGQQVKRELHSAEADRVIDRPGQGLSELGLTDAWNVFDQ